MFIASLLLLACTETRDTADTSDTDTGVPVADLAAALTESTGCADMVLAARNEDDTLAVFFRVDGLAEAAHAAGEEQVHEWNLPDGSITLELQTGRHLTHYTCNDAIEFEVVVETTRTAIAGEARLTVTPEGEPTPWGEYPARAELWLSGVVFEGAGLQSLDLPEFTIEHAVGWLPG